MKIVTAEKKYFQEIKKLANEMWLNEKKQLGVKVNEDMEDLEESLQEVIDNQKGLVYIEEEKVKGFLLYYQWESEGDSFCFCPVWGYGAEGDGRVKIMSLLFQELADRMIDWREKVHFIIKIYAHDNEMVRLFSFLQFGIECEEGLCSAQKQIKSRSKDTVIEYSKEEIKKEWKDIWHILSKLINHLKKSPVFYAGNEFTEEAYYNYLLDEKTRLFVAKKEEKIIGLITSNIDGNSFITNQKDCSNVGDVYILEEYRKTGVAQQLLAYAAEQLHKDGINTLWVEHGTANPNARGFWNKYFTSYEYTFIRDITRVK